MNEVTTATFKENGITRFFHIKEKGGKPSGDILGGIVTFLAMCYILPVNSAILSSTGMDPLGVFMATALVSGIVTLIMAFVANCPVALSAGMGLNAYLAYTVCGALGYSWQQGMVLLLVTGVLFFIFSLTPVRRKIIDAFPTDLKAIISAGLGAFIAFVGLKGAGIVVGESSTLVTLGSLSDPAVILSIVGILLVLTLMNIKTKRNLLSSLAVPMGMLSVALIGLLLHACGLKGGSDPNVNTLPWADFSTGWGWQSFGNYANVFAFGAFGSAPDIAKGGDFWNKVGEVFTNPASYAVIFSLIFVNMFDTSATLMAIGRDTDIFGNDGKMKDNKVIMADATGALICAPLGTATVTSFVESTIGVKLGARTGLASLITGGLFLLAAFIYPVFQLFTYSCVSCAALVAVGAMIFAGNLKSIKWIDPAIGFSAFITILMIVLTYSLTNGIGFGLLAYCVIMLASRRGKEINGILYVVASFYLVSFALNEVVKHL
ncbi:MAG: Guanine/hypoxanthine permease PbuG [Tenericutes bacterium ADurb.BinA155]|nr:MAG: Guanine/hypoxanthine permease PbuG [Tenericutes bacterium ADurb.BinA155]